MLTDLFSERSELLLGARYDLKTDYSNIPKALAVHLFRWGCGEKVSIARSKGPHGRPEFGPGPRLWRDAEDYLDRLDSAVKKAGSRARQTVETSIRRFASKFDCIDDWMKSQGIEAAVAAVCLEAKHWMAAECCAFLDDADLESERWQPYRAWANALSERDAVVTFNYDRVLERIIAHEHGNLEIVSPSSGISDFGKTPVFKLHGSVDWEFRAYDDSYVITSEFDTAITSSFESLGIATPGPSKRLAVGQLAMLWDSAMKHIVEADRVEFLGYRFPETDTEALFKILQALNDRSITKNKVIRIVLGPRTSDERTARVAGILSEAGHRRVECPAMWAQDYIATYALCQKS